MASVLGQLRVQASQRQEVKLFVFPETDAF